MEPRSIDYDHSGLLHLKHNIRLSVLVSSRRLERFKACINQLANTCSNPEQVEILVKVDTENSELYKFQDTLQKSPFSHQILCSPKLDEYWSVYRFQTELGKLAKAKVCWYISDEVYVRSTNWVETLLNTRDVYSDNIYLFNPLGSKIHPKYTGCPVISKEWFDTLGFYSPFPESDVFLVKLAMCLQRFHTGDTIDYQVDKHSWRLHKRSEWRIGRNWAAVKRAMNTWIEKHKHLFLAKMSDPLITPNLYGDPPQEVFWTW